jgi:hypothetical protein
MSGLANLLLRLDKFGIFCFLVENIYLLFQPLTEFYLLPIPSLPFKPLFIAILSMFFTYVYHFVSTATNTL